MDEGVKEEERIVLAGFEEVGFGREGVDRYVSFATAIAVAPAVIEAMAERAVVVGRREKVEESLEREREGGKMGMKGGGLAKSGRESYLWEEERGPLVSFYQLLPPPDSDGIGSAKTRIRYGSIMTKFKI